MSNLNTFCDALNRLTYAEMLQLAEKIQRIITAPDAPAVPLVATFADALSQVGVDGFGTNEVAKHEKAELLKLFKRKRQITVSTVAGGAYQVAVPSMGNVTVVHKDLKQALSQTVDTMVALEAMRK